jgi:putative RNA 2'-phosphotransferase
MDSAGWVAIDELLEKSKNGLTIEILHEIVAEDAKKRYSISSDGLQIRANQGHSIEVDLGLKEAIPPVPLCHGTHAGAIGTIMKEGLKKMKRHHVHLSADADTAMKVGARHGKPILLVVNTKEMVKQGIKFYLSDNGVWLVDAVGPEFLLVSAT